MRVLVVKISSMGDILHTLPSLTDAIQAIPNIRFDWVIEENFSQIPCWHEGVDNVISVGIRRWSKSWFSKSVKVERKRFQKIISKERYDAIIDAQGLLKSALLIIRLTHGVKHGMNWKTSREALASLFYDQCYYIRKRQHAVERIRELFAKSLGYKKPNNYGNYAISQYFQGEIQSNIEPYFLFLHGTTSNKKHWPETHWRKLIELIHTSGINIKLPWWSKQDRQRAERLAFGFKHVEILSQLSLEQVAKKIANSKATISVDTGLSHLSAALNQTNITLFGKTDPELIGSYGKNQYQIVSPTKKMKDISAKKIFSLLQDNHFFLNKE